MTTNSYYKVETDGIYCNQIKITIKPQKLEFIVIL